MDELVVASATVICEITLSVDSTTVVFIRERFNCFSVLICETIGFLDSGTDASDTLDVFDSSQFSFTANWKVDSRTDAFTKSDALEIGSDDCVGLVVVIVEIESGAWCFGEISVVTVVVFSFKFTDELWTLSSLGEDAENGCELIVSLIINSELKSIWLWLPLNQISIKL